MTTDTSPVPDSASRGQSVWLCEVLTTFSNTLPGKYALSIWNDFGEAFDYRGRPYVETEYKTIVARDNRWHPSQAAALHAAADKLFVIALGLAEQATRIREQAEQADQAEQAATPPEAPA